MEIDVKNLDEMERKVIDDSCKQFLPEFSIGYLELEYFEKQKQLSEYMRAYDELEDKESFNAQYIASLIDNLKLELY
ncbi:MAG: hypothetical protein ACFFFB_08640 [Candidatus Heimdallarchaeota archaeon]